MGPLNDIDHIKLFRALRDFVVGVHPLDRAWSRVKRLKGTTVLNQVRQYYESPRRGTSNRRRNPRGNPSSNSSGVR